MEEPKINQNKDQKVESNIDKIDNLDVKKEKQEVDCNLDPNVNLDTDTTQQSNIDINMKPKKGSILKEIIEWAVCIIVAVVLALVVRCFIGTPTIVKQESMFPTLKPNQRLILNRLPILMGKELQRGDIITFEAPSKLDVTANEADLNNPVAEYNYEPEGLGEKFFYNVLEITKVTFIKRVIGLPGEHIEIKDNKVYINGNEYEEPYLGPDVVTTPLDGPYTDFIVPDGYIFAMGDNRMHSKDCRAFGCVPMSRVEGKVVLRFWPINTWGDPAKY